MKKITLILVFFILYSCGNNKTINPAKPANTLKDGYISYEIVTIDECEYILGHDNGVYNGGFFLTHKGNCKNPIHYQNTTNVASPIIEVQVDYKNMPTYCKSQNYSIIKVGKKYYVRLPGGTVDDSYDTPQEAQEDINKRAEQSMKDWLESGGLKF
jgi:hypothetical protein